MIDQMMTWGTVKLIDVGRAKFCGTAMVRNEDELLREIKKHLMSQDVEYIYNFDKNLGVIFAGMHDVGRFTMIAPLDG